MKEVAELLSDWIPTVLHTIEMWVSSSEIAAGSRPMSALQSALKSTNVGIICVSRETIGKPWINFEAGAISNAVSESRVIPFLFDLSVRELVGPLAQFQAVDSSQRSEITKMMRALNELLLQPVKLPTLDRLIEALWPELDAKLKELRSRDSRMLESYDDGDGPRVKFRREHGVTRISTLEGFKTLTELPSGRFGFTVPWMADRSRIPNIDLELNPMGTVTLEVHKATDDQTYLMLWVAQGDMERLSEEWSSEPLIAHPYRSDAKQEMAPIDIRRVVRSRHNGNMLALWLESDESASHHIISGV